VVARLSEEELERKRRREEAQRPAARRGRGTTPTASRRARVAKSRQAAAKQAAPAEPLEVDEEAPFGPGSHAPLEDGGAPEGFEVKGNANSMLYHVPGSRSYEQTKAEVWFATEEDAEAAGFAKPPSQRDTDTTHDTGDETTDDRGDED
jgi:large subunit ribosomal protein L17